MHIRDEEIKRLEHYAKGLGIKVTWKPYKRGSHDGAMWVTDGSEIVICTRPRESKTSIILKFVHELSHHLAWVYNGRKGDLKTDQALRDEDALGPGEALPKEQRKLIYITERDDARFRQAIYDEVGLKIPKHIFLADKDLDIWIYYRYYITGKYPTYKSVKKKKKELIAKYKNG